MIRYFDQYICKPSMSSILLKLSGTLWEGGNTFHHHQIIKQVHRQETKIVAGSNKAEKFKP